MRALQGSGRMVQGSGRMVQGSGRMVHAAGLAGAVLGAAAIGAAAGLAVERLALRQATTAADDPYRNEPFGLLPADRIEVVTTTDGVAIHAEVIEPDLDPLPPDLTIMFVHGFCLDLGTWHMQRRHLPALLAPLGRVRMVFYDQPGHGRSADRSAGDYTLEQLGTDLATVLDVLAPAGPVVVAGHSMGGMTLMALAESEPERFASRGGRVVGVGLVSTSAGRLDDVGLGLPGPLARARKPLMPALVTGLKLRPSVLEWGRRAGTDLTYLLTRRYGFGGEHPSPTLVAYVERMIAETSLETISGYLLTLSQHERYAALEVFDGIEALVIGGDKDYMTPLEHSEEIARLLPSAAFTVINDGGHVALMEHPEVVDIDLVDLVDRSLRYARGNAPEPTLADQQADEVARREREEGAVRTGGPSLASLRRVLRGRRPA
jgi:pimeloyl-ACP methyl ester carboxylesterase